MSEFPALFSPLRVGSYTLANRIMNTGHAAHFQTGDGLPTQRYVDYVRERAKGGAGIIVTGHTVPYHDGDASLSLASYDERIVPIYARMAQATHAFDVPLLAQLGHRGRRISDAAGFLSRPTRAPSAIPAPDFSVPMIVPHAMTHAEVDYFNMWQGIVPSPRSGRMHWPSHHHEPGAFAARPRGLKEVVSLPVVGTGRVDSPALAERFVTKGVADMVGMVRALIADPHFPNKAREGRGDEIRTCIACTQSCVGHIYLGLGVGCIYTR